MSDVDGNLDDGEDDLEEARAAVLELATFPPVNDADLAARTRGIGRDELIDALEAEIDVALEAGDDPHDGHDEDDETIDASSLVALLRRLDPEHELLAELGPEFAESAAAGATIPVPAPPAARARRVEGFAWFSSCSGSGRASLAAGVRSPDGTHDVVFAVFALDGGIEAASLLEGQTKKSIERFLEPLRRDGIDFARAPLELAARVVADARERGRASGAPLDDATQRVVAWLEGVAPAPAAPLPEPLWLATPPEAVEALLRRDEYASWFLEAGELLDAGVELPREGGDAHEWLERSLRPLDRPALRARLSAMAAWMAAWHELRREPHLAALLRSLAWPPARPFAGDALAEHGEPDVACGSAPANELFLGVVARSFYLAREQLEPEDLLGELGDPQHRHELKEHHFVATSAPLAADLARLDLAEHVDLLLDWALQLVPQSRRPRHVDYGALAVRVAGAIVELRRAGATPAPLAALPEEGEAAREIVAALLPAGGSLTEQDARRVAAALERCVAEEFLAEVCPRCPVDCWRDLAREAAAPFFATLHPAIDALDALAAERDRTRDDD